MLNLDQKTIFLTGSGGVLGTQYVGDMLAAGARVVASELPGARYDGLKEKFGSDDRFHLYEMNVADEEQIAVTFDAMDGDGVKPDVYVNNASITPEFLMKGGNKFPDFSEISLEAWNKTLSVNTTGPFLVAREMDRKVIGKRPVKLVNIASMYALMAPHHDIYDGMPFKNFSAYQVTKAGTHGLTLWLASYWRKKDATVNTLAPGAVFNGHSEEFQSRVSSLIMQGRMAQPSEISQVMMFLCSDSSSHMTGQFVNVDGGYSAW